MPERIITRVLKTRPVEYTCQRCGKVVVVDLFPGPTPKYCSECAPIVKRELAMARQRERRARLRLERDQKSDADIRTGHAEES